MPDQTEQQRQQQQSQEQQAQSQGQSQPGQQQPWQQQYPGQIFDPSQVAQLFQGQSSSPSQFGSASYSEHAFSEAASREVHQQYWQQAEETLRSARRISEIYSMSMMKSHLVQSVSASVVPQLAQSLTQIITQQVTQQVISQLSSNPQISQQLAQQVASQFSQNPQLIRSAVQQAQRSS